MTLLKKAALSVAAGAALFVVVGLFLPRTAHVERSIVINAPQATVFTILNGFSRFRDWSPWADQDPNLQTTFAGPAAGVGAKMTWSGNAQVGNGSQEVVQSSPYSSVRVRLTFGDFGGEFFATYDLVPEGQATRVTWSFHADYGANLMGRYFGLLMDSALGPDYEKGLVRLKALAESLPHADFSGLSIEAVEVPAQPVVLIAARSADTSNAIGVTLGVAYSRLSGFLAAQNMKPSGPPLAVFHGKENGALKFEAALPIERTDLTPEGAIRITELPSGPVVRAVHRGAYSGLATSHAAVAAYLESSGLVRDGPYREHYISDPARTPEAELITHLVYPIQQGS